MKISNLSEAIGLTIDTIRYYEKRGLLDDSHIKRLPNGYRDYNDRAVERLRLVGRAKHLGLTLTEIASFIKEWEDSTLSEDEIRVFFREKIALVDARMEALASMRQYLCEKLENIK